MTYIVYGTHKIPYRAVTEILTAAFDKMTPEELDELAKVDKPAEPTAISPQEPLIGHAFARANALLLETVNTLQQPLADLIRKCVGDEAHNHGTLRAFRSLTERIEAHLAHVTLGDISAIRSGDNYQFIGKSVRPRSDGHSATRAIAATVIDDHPRSESRLNYDPICLQCVAPYPCMPVLLAREVLELMGQIRRWENREASAGHNCSQMEERLRRERDDALNLASEVALGITHSTACREQETPCCRCRMEEAEAALRNAMFTHGP